MLWQSLLSLTDFASAMQQTSLLEASPADLLLKHFRHLQHQQTMTLGFTFRRIMDSAVDSVNKLTRNAGTPPEWLLLVVPPMLPNRNSRSSHRLLLNRTDNLRRQERQSRRVLWTTLQATIMAVKSFTGADSLLVHLTCWASPVRFWLALILACKLVQDMA